ncbi:MAG: hypothetical protein QGI83_22940 [Candidatus Latescibacteria bacterium]|nr:hypothetical protein [Candidatus Latescibacterota bacterium]
MDPRVRGDDVCALSESHRAIWTRVLFQHRNTVLHFGTVDTYCEIDPGIGPDEGVELEESEGEFRFYGDPGAGRDGVV